MIVCKGGYRNTEAATRAVLKEQRRAAGPAPVGEVAGPRVHPAFSPLSRKYRVSALGLREGSNDARAWESKFDE